MVEHPDAAKIGRAALVHFSRRQLSGPNEEPDAGDGGEQ